ncbi:IS110 family transposase [Rhodococcus qingshengii]|uniref:IS110 family transposase n=1 Tax=Rhodococcus qingshengii TaxID=334542 RepID=UPI00210AEDC7|nr:IS110 family transposase [Rhodococcus qingshengii]MCQ4152385.1 IS110 family transposase [Rhodococcus qingshengii]
MVATIETLSEEIARIEAQIRKLFDAHPDQKIFASLPRSGIVRAATLLAEIGDCRERFPTDDALAALAGASPSTRQSGKHGQTVFRWSCNKKLRRAVMDFANGSRLGDEWAMQVYQRASARGCRHPHAIDDPRTRLDPHHLALLARRNPLQSATAHQPKTLGCLLT